MGVTSGTQMPLREVDMTYSGSDDGKIVFPGA
jgi:hypothetical protein